MRKTCMTTKAMKIGVSSGTDSFKLLAEILILAFLVVLNLRGVKESVTLLTPIFIAFVVMHVFLILYAIGVHLRVLPALFHHAARDFHGSVNVMGWLPLTLLILRAYSLGGGTYTGIEAVSNGVSMLREPRIITAKRTMAL